MSQITIIPRSAGAARLAATARFFAGLRGFKLQRVRATRKNVLETQE